MAHVLRLAPRRQGHRRSIGLASYLVFAHGSNDFLTLDALMSSFHEVVVGLGSDSFPFTERDLNRSSTVVIGALAKERHRLRVPHAILNEIAKSLICLSKTYLVLLSAGGPRRHA
jgi:hypothetical protein